MIGKKNENIGFLQRFAVDIFLLNGTIGQVQISTKSSLIEYPQGVEGTVDFQRSSITERCRMVRGPLRKKVMYHSGANTKLSGCDGSKLGWYRG